MTPTFQIWKVPQPTWNLGPISPVPRGLDRPRYSLGLFRAHSTLVHALHSKWSPLVPCSLSLCPQRVVLPFPAAPVCLLPMAKISDGGYTHDIRIEETSPTSCSSSSRSSTSWTLMRLGLRHRLTPTRLKRICGR